MKEHDFFQGSYYNVRHIPLLEDIGNSGPFCRSYWLLGLPRPFILVTFVCYLSFLCEDRNNNKGYQIRQTKLITLQGLGGVP